MQSTCVTCTVVPFTRFQTHNDMVLHGLYRPVSRKKLAKSESADAACSILHVFIATTNTTTSQTAPPEDAGFLTPWNDVLHIAFNNTMSCRLYLLT